MFTLAGNRRRIKEAEERAAEKAAKEAEKRVRREWEAWYEQVKADLAAGRDPSVPPPNGSSGSGNPNGE